MLTTQVIPLLKQLSYSEKLLLVNLLVAELLDESGLTPLPVEQKAVNQGLHDSFEAAAILAKVLTQNKELAHGQ